jgi:hypothetical protein
VFAGPFSLAALLAKGAALEMSWPPLLSRKISERPVPPVPYPSTRSRDARDELVVDLLLRWGGQWDNPGK